MIETLIIQFCPGHKAIMHWRSMTSGTNICDPVTVLLGLEKKAYISAPLLLGGSSPQIFNNKKAGRFLGLESELNFEKLVVRQ